MIWIWFALVVMLTTFLVLMSRRVRQAQVRLGRMESRLAAVLAGPDAGLSVWDPDGRLVGFNPRFKEFYPDAPLKPGLVFEDLIRYTVNRGLVRVPDDDNDDGIERWVSERVERFGTPSHEVLRTPDGRWLDVYTRSTDAGEVLLLYSDTTATRETEASLIDRGQQLERHTADLQLLADVIHAGREESFESAAAQIVERVCAWSAWPVGFVYRVVGTGTEDSVSLDVVASSYEDTDDSGRFAQLRALVAREARDDGSGVARRAHKTGRVVWVPNVSVDPAVDPDRLSVMTGVRGVCAVPVIHEGQVVAVLEFLSSDQLTPDPSTTRLLEATAEVLASVLTSRNAG